MTLDAVRIIGELRKERDRLDRVVGILDGGEAAVAAVAA
jgi:hypothetical protein